MFGSRHRAERKASEAAARKAEAQRELRDTIVKLIGLAEGQDETGPERESDSDWALVLKPGERLVSTVQGGGLFEPRRGPGHWSGRSAGVSVPVPDTRIRVRVGKSAGTFVQGAETPTVIDTGSISITTQRVVFQGDKYTREWDYARLIGVIHYSDKPATAIQVSNRQKTSGIVYAGVNSTEPVRLAITVAIAMYRGETAETLKELRDELSGLDAAQPPAALPAAAASPEAKGPRPPEPPAVASPEADGPRPPEPPAVASPEADGPRPPQPAAVASPEADGPRPPQPPAVARPTPAPGTPPPPATRSAPGPMWALDPAGRHQYRWWTGTTWSDYVSDDGRQFQDPLPSRP